MKVRTRIAPSPTGFMHIGTLWLALHNVMFTRQNGGTFILRIEDTDQTREVKGSVENLLKTLAWADLLPDEGPTVDGEERGEYGPYFQSKRLPIYRKYIDELLKSGNAYWCDCSHSRLDEMKELQKISKQQIRYDGSCREKNLSSGEVVRLKIPRDRKFEWNDLIRGTISISSDEVDDQVILKSDGFPTYHLAVVVDDHLMEISHVFRGEEWISSTPKHLFLYEAFGWKQTEFAHMPLLLNPDKTKLSKRQGDVSVESYIQKGYLPEALLNFLAIQGWNPSGSQEIYTRDELIAAYDVSKINKAGSVVNYEKLDWLNGHYIRLKPLDELTQLCLSYLSTGLAFERAKKIVSLFQERLTKLSDIAFLSAFIFELPVYEPSLLVWKKSTVEKSSEVLQTLKNYCATLDTSLFDDNKKIEETILLWIKDNEFNNGDVLWPMRVALSGLQNSPPPCAIASVLGKDETIKRLEFAFIALSAIA